MPLKIAIISTTVFRNCSPYGTQNYAGLEVIAWQCAKGLAAKGHQVSLIAPDGSECPGVTVIPTGPERQHDEKMAYSGYKEIGNEYQVARRAHAGYWQHLLDMNVIIDHSWSKSSYLLKEEGKLKAPILGVCHAPIDGMFKTPPPVEKPCIVCISEDQKNHYENLFPMAKAKVCYNGIDLSLYRDLKLPRTNRFLFLGRFSSVKGPNLAIEIALRTGRGLDMIGDTSITNEPDLLRECKAKADGKQIVFLGSCNRGETTHWYSKNSALLHCNQIFKEPFGLAPVEAQACGMAVLAFDYGAMRETIRHASTGYLVRSLAEAIQIVQSGELDRIDRKACIENAQRFSEQAMVNRYETLCLEALDGGW